MKVQVSMQFGSEWRAVGPALSPGDPPGSMSSEEPDGRQVIVFGYMNGVPGVWRSIKGFDAEFGPMRSITTAQLDLLSDLKEPYECITTHPRLGIITSRIALVDQP